MCLQRALTDQMSLWHAMEWVWLTMQVILVLGTCFPLLG